MTFRIDKKWGLWRLLLVLSLAKVANSAASAKTAHGARLLGAKLNRSLAKPHGNYVHSEFQFGTIHAIHSGPTPTVDFYPNGAQGISASSLILGVKCMQWYKPTVGDVVLIYRGMSRNRSSRIVLGKVNGSASPYPVPLGGFDSDGRYTNQLNSLWGASGVPSDDLGAAGDWCLSENGHLYWSDAGTWTEKV